MTTERTLLDAFAAERGIDIEKMTGAALAGQLVLNEGSVALALAAIQNHPEGHILHRALPHLQDTTTVYTHTFTAHGPKLDPRVKSVQFDHDLSGVTLECRTKKDRDTLCADLIAMGMTPKHPTAA